ncbi:MAG: MFS transporter [Deltaproteobacteria bacterium]|nr:MFS transporter [Deltaproteobacteria bacterium]
MTDQPSHTSSPWQANARVLALASVVVTTGFGVFFPYVPLMLTDLGVTGHLETWVGVSSGVFFLLSFFLQPVWGQLADHYGKKPMVLRASLGMGVLFCLLPFPRSLPVFLGLFVLLGVTNGFTAAALALVASQAPAGKSGPPMSLVQMGGMAGNALGPLAGAVAVLWIARHQDLFWISGGLALLGGAMILLLVKETPAPREHGPVFNPLSGLGELWRAPGARALFLGQFLWGVVFFGAVPMVSVFTLQLAKDTLAKNTLAREMGSLPAFSGGHDALVDGLAVDTWVGLVVTATTLASAVSAWLWGRLTLPPQRMLALALGLTALTLLPVALAQSPAQLTVARAVYGLAAMGMAVSLVVLMAQRAPQGMTARMMAVGNAFAMLGVGAGPLAGGVIGPLFGLRAFFGLQALALGAMAWWWWRNNRSSTFS